MNEKAGTQNPSHAETRFSRLRDVSTGRAVLWLEVAVGAMMLISIAIDGWEKSQIETFNAVFIFLLIAAVVLGLGLFIQKNLAMERRAALVTAMILAGCLMVAYSALMYESGDAIFILSAVPGAGLAIAGVGALVVRESIAGRLAGYYALWIFGLLVIMFMPLNELMALGYSSRDMLVGFFGFGISVVGAASFAVERSMAQRMETWVTAGDAKYIAGKFDDAVEYYEHALLIEPRNAKGWANKGSALLRMGMWAKAVECFDRAVELSPNLAITHSGRGLALTYLKRYSEALESHDMAIRLDSGPANWNNKGNTLMRMGGPVKDAIACYRKALESDEKYHIAWFNRGKAELMNDDVKDAIESLTRAVELNPQFADAWFQKGKALSMSGKRDQEALYCFDTAIELKPANAEAWMERKILLTSMKERKTRPIPLVNIPGTGVVFGPVTGGRRLLETAEPGMNKADITIAKGGMKLRDGALRMATMGDYGSALRALDQRLATAPDDVVTHMTKGVLLSRIARFDDALAAFDSAMRLKPDWVGPLFSRGMILAAKGDYDGAYSALDQVTDKRPNYADAWSVKGIILGTQKKYAEAIECFDRAIEIDPESEDAWRSKSTALNKLGRYDEAILCYEKLAALSPAIGEAHLREERGKLEDAKTLFRQGVDLAKSRLYDEGLSLLRDAVALRPNYVDALYISGVINGVLGRYQEAKGHFERVLELRHNHTEAMYGKANILLKLGEHRGALEMLERVLELNPEHVDAWCDRGVALVRMGKRADAMECYDRALRIAGDHPQAIAQRERCVKAMKEATE